MEKATITKTAQQTRELGESLAKELVGGAILCLHGELGAGKTTFVQGLAIGLGVSQRIVSPTFVIVRQYSQKIHFFHIDLYRIESKQDLQGLGIEEIINDPQNIVAIEWAEKLGDLLPRKRIDIQFQHMTENERKITVSSE